MTLSGYLPALLHSCLLGAQDMAIIFKINIITNYWSQFLDPTVQVVYSCKYGRSLVWLLFKQFVYIPACEAL